MDFSGKLYVAIKSWFDNIYDLYVNPTPKNVVLQNAKVDEQGNVSDVTIPNMAMQGKKVDDFVVDARATMTNIFKNNSQKKVFVVGDRTKFYPVLIPIKSRDKVNKVNISRAYYHEDRDVIDINGIANPERDIGNCQIEFSTFLDHWGNGGNTNILIQNNYAFNIFLANYKVSAYNPKAVVVWLRGNHSYYLSNDMLDLENFEMDEIHLATAISFESDANAATAADVASNANGGTTQRCKDGSIALRYSSPFPTQNFEVLDAVDAIIPNMGHYYIGKGE